MDGIRTFIINPAKLHGDAKVLVVSNERELFDLRILNLQYLMRLMMQVCHTEENSGWYQNIHYKSC